jgi:hypothetical protein
MFADQLAANQVQENEHQQALSTSVYALLPHQIKEAEEFARPQYYVSQYDFQHRKWT